MGDHFISYSHRDGGKYADQVCQALKDSSHGFHPLIDKEFRVPGFDYEPDIRQAIGRSHSLLLILTRDSAQSPNCLAELRQAKGQVKPILSLRFDRDAEKPLNASSDFIDFPPRADRWKRPLRQLYDSLSRIESPAGQLRQLDERIKNLRRDLESADRARKRTLQERLDGLEGLRAELQRLVDDEAGSAERANEEIERSLVDEHAREAPRPVRSRTLYLPGPLPSAPGQPEFRDRENEIRVLRHHLGDQDVRLVLVHGREGAGKTRMVLRLLEEVGTPTSGLTADAVVYRSARGLRRFTVADLLANLRQVVAHGGGRPGAPPPDADATPLDRLDAILAQLGRVRVIFAIDDAEELLDPVTLRYRDPFLGEALGSLVNRSRHRVKLVLIGRVEPRPLETELPERVPRLALDVGLPDGDARFLLDELDPGGLMGLEETPGLFERAYALTGGLPRSLEALYGSLTLPNALYGSLAELLDAIPPGPPEQVLDFLMAEMFSSLDSQARNVAQALAVYDRPVLPGAVDHLLDARLPHERSLSVLERLRSYRLTRRQGKRHFLSHSDAVRVRGLIPRDEPAGADRRPSFTQRSLFHRAAEYYAMARRRQHPIADVDDLGTELAEIDLRLEAEEHAEAFRLLDEVADGHLDGWGQGHVVVAQRERLVGRIGDSFDELRNLAALGDAYAQRDDQDAAIGYYERALMLAREHRWSTPERKLLVNLGSTRAEQGRIQEAVACYEEARAVARRRGRPADEAAVLAGLATWHARAGRLTKALELGREALELAAQGEPDLGTLLLRSMGSWEGQLGRALPALELLQRSQERAQRSGSVLAEGHALVASGEVLIDQGRIARAVAAATRATEIARQFDNWGLLRSANSVLALAHLCAGGLEAAWRAIDLAGRHPARRRAVTTLYLQSVIALLVNDRETAANAATAALGGVEALRRRKDQDVDVLDGEGLSWCALGLCGAQYRAEELDGGQDPFDLAVGAFRRARSVSRAPGTVARVVRLLCELEEISVKVDARDRLATVLRAAAG